MAPASHWPLISNIINTQDLKDAIYYAAAAFVSYTLHTGPFQGTLYSSEACHALKEEYNLRARRSAVLVKFLYFL
jgi:hypothetical protein